MTQRIQKTKQSVEIETIKKHLDRQDKILEGLQGDNTVLEKSMKEILDLLKGSFIMDSKGLIQNMKDMREIADNTKTELSTMALWIKNFEDSKGTLTIRFSVLFTRVLAVIGGLGVVASIALAIKELLEK